MSEEERKHLCEILKNETAWEIQLIGNDGIVFTDAMPLLLFSQLLQDFLPQHHDKPQPTVLSFPDFSVNHLGILSVFLREGHVIATKHEIRQMMQLTVILGIDVNASNIHIQPMEIEDPFYSREETKPIHAQQNKELAILGYEDGECIGMGSSSSVREQSTSLDEENEVGLVPAEYMEVVVETAGQEILPTMPKLDIPDTVSSYDDAESLRYDRYKQKLREMKSPKRKFPQEQKQTFRYDIQAEGNQVEASDSNVDDDNDSAESIDSSTESSSDEEQPQAKLSKSSRKITMEDKITRRKPLIGAMTVYDCSDCDRIFATEEILNNHLSTVHSISRRAGRYKCSHCDYRTDISSHMKAHMLKHSGQKPFTCLDCGKGFSMRTTFLRHRMIHTGNKPFECQQCGKRFTERAQLEGHVRSHNNERPFICSVCSKGFIRKNDLQRHHLEVHVKLKQFACTLCEKQFTAKDRLSEHMFVHTRESKHKCDVCLKMFATKYKLNKHMSRHCEQDSQ